MEHQTCVAYGSSLINGTLTWESLTAHELSHMWWGDCVTYADWTQIYLSEGFATYSEAIWAEALGGLGAYRQSMYTMMSDYLGSGEWYFPLDQPDVLWGFATYEKGACVVHMLRQVLGDSLFFDGLARFRSDHEYGNATTDSLEISFEASTGMELTWFFDQWIRSPGHPELTFTWSTYDYQNGDVGLEIEVNQIQDIGPVFASRLSFHAIWRILRYGFHSRTPSRFRSHNFAYRVISRQSTMIHTMISFFATVAPNMQIVWHFTLWNSQILATAMEGWIPERMRKSLLGSPIPWLH